MHERLCDPKLQIELGQVGPRFWNVLLVYRGHQAHGISGFDSLTCTNLSLVKVPGIVRVETREGVAAVSLRGASELERPEIIIATRQFHDRAGHFVSHGAARWVLHEALLLGDKVEGITDKFAVDDILVDMLGSDFSEEGLVA
jgi:hypothetical protein